MVKVAPRKRLGIITIVIMAWKTRYRGWLWLEMSAVVFLAAFLLGVFLSAVLQELTFLMRGNLVYQAPDNALIPHIATTLVDEAMQ